MRDCGLVRLQPPDVVTGPANAISLTTVAPIPPLPGALLPLSWPDLSIASVRSLFGAMLLVTLPALTEAAAIARRCW